MEYNLKYTGISSSSEVQEYLDKKVAHFEKILSGPNSAQFLEIDLAHDATLEEKYKVAFRLRMNAKHIYAQASGTSLHEAIDIAAAELGREIVKIKGKRKHMLRTQAARVKDFFKGFRNRM